MISIEIYKRILSSLILLPISLFFVIKGSILFILFILTCYFIASFEWQNMSKNKPYNFLGHMFLILSFFSVFYIRNYFGENSLFIFLLLILICISSDLGGYSFGKIIKGPKLTKISPKKTYSGAIGGFILAIFFSIIYFDFSHNITEKNIVLGKKEFIGTANYLIDEIQNLQAPARTRDMIDEWESLLDSDYPESEDDLPAGQEYTDKMLADEDEKRKGRLFDMVNFAKDPSSEIEHEPDEFLKAPQGTTSPVGTN